jgi:hypothetical protein
VPLDAGALRVSREGLAQESLTLMRVLHVVCASLREGLEKDEVAEACALASGLRAAEGAEAVVVARSPRELLVATWLVPGAGLEAFAASEAHMAFIMRGVASVTSGMWSAAVETVAEPPSGKVEALWVFGLRAADELYEWQVRAFLDEVAALPGRAASGVTFEERDRFRGAGVVCLAPGERAAFEAGLEALLRREEEMAGSLESAFASVVGTG